ncbi:MAG: GntR family transcriptional regulator [Betaproteobacteria bacterium]|nr:GntR family transcriptional regulator [Betaproteobacteria bacterium]
MPSHSASIFSISTGSTEPIYRQLVSQVQRQVAGGQLAPGDAMPSVRDVARTLALNPLTVSKAYSLLESEGLLQRRRGLGMWVADIGARKGSSATMRAEMLRPTLERAAVEAAQLEIDPKTALSIFAKILKGKR